MSTFCDSGSCSGVSSVRGLLDLLLRYKTKPIPQSIARPAAEPTAIPAIDPRDNVDFSSGNGGGDSEEFGGRAFGEESVQN